MWLMWGQACFSRYLIPDSPGADEFFVSLSNCSISSTEKSTNLWGGWDGGLLWNDMGMMLGSTKNWSESKFAVTWCPYCRELFMSLSAGMRADLWPWCHAATSHTSALVMYSLAHSHLVHFIRHLRANCSRGWSPSGVSWMHLTTA